MSWYLFMCGTSFYHRSTKGATVLKFNKKICIFTTIILCQIERLTLVENKYVGILQHAATGTFSL